LKTVIYPTIGTSRQTGVYLELVGKFRAARRAGTRLAGRVGEGVRVSEFVWGAREAEGAGRGREHSTIDGLVLLRGRHGTGQAGQQRERIHVERAVLS
jgi:hypothetical protein